LKGSEREGGEGRVTNGEGREARQCPGVQKQLLQVVVPCFRSLYRRREVQSRSRHMKKKKKSFALPGNWITFHLVRPNLIPVAVLTELS
jgi:hypothetical protein